VSILKCDGNSKQQAVLMANNTAKAVILTSNTAVCMYPLFGLMHRCAYWFGEDRSKADIDGYNLVMSHLLPGQDPLARAMRTELGGERSLCDKQCFVIPPDHKGKRNSEWAMTIQSAGMVTWRDSHWGLISSNWQSLKQMIAIVQKDRNCGVNTVCTKAFGLNNRKLEIMDIIEIGDAGAVMQLVERGADVNATDNYGRSVLSRAVELGLTDIARLLIERDANVDAMDNYGRSVLSRAVEIRLTDIAMLLIERDANVDAMDNYGRSVLSRAVEIGLTDIARLLIERGAKVSARDRQNVHANTEQSK
jgi:hypothetical protein